MKRKSFTILAIFALCAPLAPAQQPLPVHGESEQVPLHLEQPDDPQAIDIRANERVSPRGIYAYNGHVSYQVNVNANGNNILFDAANEPSITVNFLNPLEMAIGWRQFDTTLNNFRQAGNAHTTDGGLTWTNPGVIDPGIFRSDPVLASDTQGRFYYNSLTANAENEFHCDVYRSDDSGATWDAGVFAWGGDKQWMTVDLTSGIGQDNLYAYWTRQYGCPECEGNFTRSYDRGVTWLSAADTPSNPFWGTLTVASDGTLYIAGRGFVVLGSDTVQDPNATLTWNLNTIVDLGGDLTFSGGPNPGGLLGQVWIASDHSGGPSDGNLYLAASINPSGSTDPLDVHFSRSTDNGATWSMPIRVNDDDPDNGAYQWFGTMSVAPNGRIDMVWLDTRNNPGGVDSQLYYSFSTDEGETWAASVPLTPLFDPHVGWPNQNKMGDYFDMISDNDGANLAFATTLNGEQDVYFMYIRNRLAVLLAGDLPELAQPGEPVDISVRIREGIESLVVDSPTLHYRYDDGEFRSLPLLHVEGELYSGQLPSPYCDATVEFYVTAEGTESGLVSLPGSAPTKTLGFEIGSIDNSAYFDFETADGWTVQSDLNLTDGEWMRGIPVDCNRGDPPADFDGSGQCFLTDNAALPNCNSDVDGGTTWLISPVIDATQGDTVISYAVWYTNNVGANPNQDVMLVEITNDMGLNWYEADRLGPVSAAGWSVRSFAVADIALPTDNIRVRFAASDVDPAAVVEAGIDRFSVDIHMCEDAFGDGDFDLDGDVDLFVAAKFQACFGGVAAYDCNIGNFAVPETIDIDDFTAFSTVITGP